MSIKIIKNSTARLRPQPVMVRRLCMTIATVSSLSEHLEDLQTCSGEHLQDLTANLGQDLETQLPKDFLNSLKEDATICYLCVLGCNWGYAGSP